MLYWVKGRGNLLHRVEEGHWRETLCGAPITTSITIYMQKSLALKEQKVRGVCHKCQEAVRHE